MQYKMRLMLLSMLALSLCFFSTGTYKVTALDVLDPEYADQIINPRSFGAKVDGVADDTYAVTLAAVSSINNHSRLLIPHGTKHNLNFYADNVKFFDKQNVASKLPLAKDIFKQNSETNFHFIGDSITAGAISVNWDPTKQRETLGYSNLFAYGIQRYGVFEKDSRTASFTGVSTFLPNAQFASLIDLGGLLASGITPNSMYCYYQKAGDGQKATYTIPSTGELSIFMPRSADSALTIKTEISINNSAWFSPKSSDGVYVEGFSNPALLDFTGTQRQVVELKVKSSKNKLVKFRMWTEDTGRSIYLPNNFARYGNTLTVLATGDGIYTNQFDAITGKKIIGLAENEFHTITINYLLQPGVQQYFNVKFIKNDGTLADPSTITGLKFFDSTNAGTLNQVQHLDSAIKKWKTRSYFLDDKTKLSAQGIIGVVLYENTTGFSIHNISFHGLVNNVAISGITTGDFYTNQLPSLLPYIKTGDYVFINLGMNDWILQTGSTLELKNNYRKIVSDLKNRGANVVMIVPNPPIFSVTNSTISDSRNLNFNDIVESIYDISNELNVYLIDIYSMYRSIGNFSAYMKDNVHPNDAGHLIIAQRMLQSFGSKID